MATLVQRVRPPFEIITWKRRLTLAVPGGRAWGRRDGPDVLAPGCGSKIGASHAAVNTNRPDAAVPRPGLQPLVDNPDWWPATDGRVAEWFAAPSGSGRPPMVGIDDPGLAHANTVAGSYGSPTISHNLLFCNTIHHPELLFDKQAIAHIMTLGCAFRTVRLE
jgi:hypothetical protein